MIGIKEASAKLKDKLLNVNYECFQDENFINYLKNYIEMYDVIIQR